eukprot:gene2899-5689_t
MNDTKVFIPDQENIWLRAEVLRNVSDTEIEVKIEDEDSLPGKSGHIRTISFNPGTFGDTFPLQNTLLQETGVDDMCNLSYLHEPGILENLRIRYTAQLPYTYVGETCIAINPYKKLSIYTDDLKKHYASKKKQELPPHVYATSAAAYRNIRMGNTNQSILVSGESGAGKTETVKILMGHLAHVAGSRNDSNIDKMLQAHPLLESFGNAKTSRNDNSSRFGKFMLLQFDVHCRLVGSKCETYLLEKTRVVSQNDCERNYHVFYQLLASPESITKPLHLTGLNCRDFDYMSQGDLDTQSIESITDADHFCMTIKALGTIGITPDQINQILRVLAGLLFLGQVRYCASDGTDADSSTVSPENEECKVCCELLGVEYSVFACKTTVRAIDAGGAEVVVPLSVDQAVDVRDALAKEVYGRLFLWLVNIINNNTACQKSVRSVGLLDIFGFESFEVNRFEQLCINYANEKLQQKFTRDVFRNVQEEYQTEGIQWELISFKDNDSVLDLIEGKLGVIACLNEECVMPRGSDPSFLSKVRSAAAAHPSFVVNLVKRDEFTVMHYAGRVSYSVNGFVDRNKDALPGGISQLLGTSSNPLLQTLFDSTESKSSNIPGPALTSPAATHRRSKSSNSLKNSPLDKKANSFMRAETVTTKFRSQLSNLMDCIESTDVQYVRCIKPNGTKSSSFYHRSMVVDQLRCAGIIEAIRISRAAYPNRMLYRDFSARFGKLWSDLSLKRRSEETPDKHVAYKIMKRLFVSSGDLSSNAQEMDTRKLGFELGQTRVYFSRGLLERLEAQRGDIFKTYAVSIQAVARGRKRRIFYKKLRLGMVFLQSRFRGKVTRRRLSLLPSAMVLLQYLFRKRNAVKRNNAVITIQCAARRYMACRLRSKLMFFKLQQIYESPPRKDSVTVADDSPFLSMDTLYDESKSYSVFHMSVDPFTALDADEKTLRQRNEELQVQVAHAQEVSNNYKSELDVYLAENVRLGCEVDKLRHRLEEKSVTCNTMGDKIGMLENRLRVESESAATALAFQNEETNEFRQMYEDLKVVVDDIRKERDDSLIALEELREEYMNTKESLEQSNKNIVSDYEESMSFLQSTRVKMESRMDELMGEVEAMAELRTTLMQRREDIKQLRADNTILEAKLFESKQELESQKESMSEQIRDLESLLLLERESSNDLLQRHTEVTNNLTETIEELNLKVEASKALEIDLRRNLELESILEETTRSMTSQMEALKTCHEAAVAEYEETLKDKVRESDVLLAEKNALEKELTCQRDENRLQEETMASLRQTISIYHNTKESIETANKDVVSSYEAMVGSLKKSGQDLENRLKELRDELDVSKSESLRVITDLQMTLKQSEENVNGLERDKKSLENNMTELKQRLLSCEEDLRITKENLNTSDTERQKIEEESVIARANFEQTRAALVVQLEEASYCLSEANDRENNLVKDLDTLKQSTDNIISSLNTEIENLSNEVSEAKNEILRKENEFMNLEVTMQKDLECMESTLRGKLESVEIDFKRLFQQKDDDIAIKEEKLLDLQLTYDKIVIELSEAQESLVNSKMQFESISEQLLAVQYADNSLIAALEDSCKEYQANLHQLSADITNINMKLLESNEENKQLQIHIDRLQSELSDVKTSMLDMTSDNEAMVGSLKNRLKELRDELDVSKSESLRVITDLQMTLKQSEENVSGLERDKKNLEDNMTEKERDFIEQKHQWESNQVELESILESERNKAIESQRILTEENEELRNNFVSLKSLKIELKRDLDETKFELRRLSAEYEAKSIVFSEERCQNTSAIEALGQAVTTIQKTSDERLIEIGRIQRQMNEMITQHITEKDKFIAEKTILLEEIATKDELLIIQKNAVANQLQELRVQIGVELEECKCTLQKKNEQINVLMTTVEALKSSETDLRRDVEDSKAEISTLTTEKETLEQLNTNMSSELAPYREEKKLLLETMEGLKRNVEMNKISKDVISSYESMVASLKRSGQDLEANLKLVREELDYSKAESELIISDLKKVINERDNHISKLILENKTLNTNILDMKNDTQILNDLRQSLKETTETLEQYKTDNLALETELNWKKRELEIQEQLTVKRVCEMRTAITCDTEALDQELQLKSEELENLHRKLSLAHEIESSLKIELEVTKTSLESLRADYQVAVDELQVHYKRGVEYEDNTTVFQTLQTDFLALQEIRDSESKSFDKTIQLKNETISEYRNRCDDLKRIELDLRHELQEQEKNYVALQTKFKNMKDIIHEEEFAKNEQQLQQLQQQQHITVKQQQELESQLISLQKDNTLLSEELQTALSKLKVVHTEETEMIELLKAKQSLEILSLEQKAELEKLRRVIQDHVEVQQQQNQKQNQKHVEASSSSEELQSMQDTISFSNETVTVLEDEIKTLIEERNALIHIHNEEKDALQATINKLRHNADTVREESLATIRELQKSIIYSKDQSQQSQPAQNMSIDTSKVIQSSFEGDIDKITVLERMLQQAEKSYETILEKYAAQELKITELQNRLQSYEMEQESLQQLQILLDDTSEDMKEGNTQDFQDRFQHLVQGIKRLLNIDKLPDSDYDTETLSIYDVDKLPQQQHQITSNENNISNINKSPLSGKKVMSLSSRYVKLLRVLSLAAVRQRMFEEGQAPEALDAFLKNKEGVNVISPPRSPPPRDNIWSAYASEMTPPTQDVMTRMADRSYMSPKKNHVLDDTIDTFLSNRRGISSIVSSGKSPTTLKRERFSPSSVGSWSSHSSSASGRTTLPEASETPHNSESSMFDDDDSQSTPFVMAKDISKIFEKYDPLRRMMPEKEVYRMMMSDGVSKITIDSFFAAINSSKSKC